MKTNSLWDKRTGRGERGEWLRAVGVLGRTVPCRVCRAVRVHCVRVCAECANMAGCVVLAVGLAWAVVWENAVCSRVGACTCGRGRGGYPIFWVKAGMEGC